MEPSVNPDLVGAVVVPDGSIDPFRLTASNVMDATENGAKMFTYCEVKNLIREGGKVIGVDVYDHKNRVNRKFFAPLVVNAGGIWGQGIAEYADLKIKMFPAKGALLVMGHRINKLVINRCRNQRMRTFLYQVIPFVLSVQRLAVYLTIKSITWKSPRKKWIFYSVKGKNLRQACVILAYYVLMQACVH